MTDIEIFSTGASRQVGNRCAVSGDRIGIRIGSEVRTMTAGEWSQLISAPKPFVYIAPDSDPA